MLIRELIPTKRTACAAGASLVLALGLGACGSDDESGGGDAEPAAATSGEQGAGSSTTPATTPAPAPAPDAAEPLATREGSIEGDAVTAEIVALKRSGATLVLNFRLRATQPDADINAQVASNLANDIFEDKPGTKQALPSDNLDGITLVDTKNRKRHLVARDANNTCVCSTGLGSVFVRGDAPVNLSATFGAPPADVKALDVTIPSFGTFTDVPLS
jgi:hypothetical protein